MDRACRSAIAGARFWRRSVGGILTPDPTLLPVASTSQAPDTTAYNALDVETLAAGATYADPVSGETIHKLTHTNFPTASNPACAHDYADGGDEVSLPWDGNKRTIKVLRLGSPFDHYLFDFEPGVGVSNPRQLTGTMEPDRDLCFSFSNNPATPYYCYITNGGTTRRFDFRDGSEVTGGGWPWSGSTDTWLHQSKDDARFVAWRIATSTMVMYEPSSATQKTYQNANANEPRLERDGRYVGLSMNTPGNGLTVWDWNDNAVDWTHGGDPDEPFAHNASLRSRFVGVSWNEAAPYNYWICDPAVADTFVNPAGGAVADLLHGSGNWIQSQADPDDQWCIFGKYNSPLDPGASYVGRGGIVFVRSSGGRRFLCHAYNTSAVYERFPFAKLSPDGKFVLFTSNMNGQSRCDLFLAEVPTG